MGNQDQIEGKFEQARGDIKENLGDAMNDDRMEREGQLDQAKGNVREGIGDLREGLEDAVDGDRKADDYNR